MNPRTIETEVTAAFASAERRARAQAQNHPNCDCCDHPLQHVIRRVLARNEAPIPYEGRTLEALMAELRDGLDAFEETA